MELEDKKKIYAIIVMLCFLAGMLGYEFTSGNGFGTNVHEYFLFNFLIAAGIMIGISWLEMWYIFR